MIYFCQQQKDIVIMWLFKSKNNHQQDDKYNFMEENEKMFREMKAKFEQKIKMLAKNVKSSEEYFLYYSKLTPQEQELLTSFEEMIKTLEGLISIIQQLKKQVDHLEGDLAQSHKFKEMIGNHHTIINTIQDMHTAEINKLQHQQNAIIQHFNLKISQKNDYISKVQSQKEEIESKLQDLQQKYATLKLQNQNTKKQNTKLLQQYQQKEMMYNQLFDKKTQNKKIVNLNSIKLQYMFYYNRLKQKIFGYLSIPDLLELKRGSKFYRHLIKTSQSELIFKKVKEAFEKKQLKSIVNLKYYERILQLFPLENIKVNALKYLYFKIKPATYILPYLQEELQSIDEKEIQHKIENKSKFNWRQLFSTQKSKKEETKFTISQLKNAEEYKKIENKIQHVFRGLLNFKLPEDLIYYSNTMENQLGQLKRNLNSKNHNKQSYLAWTTQLHCLAKFMYLQTHELYNLLQVIFGQLIIKNRQLITIREKHDELRQNQGMLRTLIENISYDKSNIQKKSILIQNQIIKRNLQNDILTNNIVQINRQRQEIRSRHENLSQQYQKARKTLERWEQDRKKQDNNIRLIRQQIEELQLRTDNKNRKYSVVSSQEDH